MQQIEFELVEVLDDGDAVMHLRAVDPDGAEQPRLSIWIGPQEAALIAIAATARRAPRPLTHDLLQSLLQAFELEVERAVITALRGDVFHARLIVTGAGRQRSIDCRPADAIALALRQGAPMFVDDEVLQQQAQHAEP